MARHEEVSYITDSPRISDVDVSNSTLRTFHWETPDGRHIFVYATFKLQQLDGKTVLLAKTNIDSSEVKGQGEYIWRFLQRELQKYSKKGFRDIPAMPIIHEVAPNKHSLRLVESDGEYVRRGELFYGLYE